MKRVKVKQTGVLSLEKIVAALTDPNTVLEVSNEQYESIKNMVTIVEE